MCWSPAAFPRLLLFLLWAISMVDAGQTHSAATGALSENRHMEVTTNGQIVERAVPQDGGIQELCNGAGFATPMCSIRGDPHIMSFDTYLSQQSYTFSPKFAEGHFWLVRTKYEKYNKLNIVSIQGMYEKCGHRGTQSNWQKKGVTCLTGIGIGGSFQDDSAGKPYTLVVRPPCDWHWEKSVCHRKFGAKGQAYVTWDGARVKKTFALDDPAVQVTLSTGKVRVELPLGIIVSIGLRGAWKTPSGRRRQSVSVPETFLDVYIEMPKCLTDTLQQAGHCGNLNGDQLDDQIYQEDGTLKPEKLTGFGLEKMQSFYDALVHCKDRLIRLSGECIEKPKPIEETLCKPRKHKRAYRKCRCMLRKQRDMSRFRQIEALNECIDDECLQPDVAEAEWGRCR